MKTSNDNLLLTAIQMMASAAQNLPNTGKGGGAEFKKLMTEKSQEAQPVQTADGTQATAEETQETPAPVQNVEGDDQELRQEIAAAMTAVSSMVIQPQIVTEEAAPPVQAIPEEILPVQVQGAAELPVEVVPADEASLQTAELEPETVEFQAEMPEVKAQEKPAEVQTEPQQTAQAPEEAVQTVKTGGEAHEARQESQDSGMAQGDRKEDVKVEYGAEQAEKPLFHDVKATPIKVGEAPVVDTQAQDMDADLAKELGQALEAGAQRIEIQLTPENLGTITVEMTRTQDGALEVVFHTTTEKAANLLNQHSANLGALLQNNNQQGTVQVTVQRQEEAQQNQQHQNQQHQNQNAPQQDHHRRSDSEDFLQQLRLGLVPAEEEDT